MDYQFAFDQTGRSKYGLSVAQMRGFRGWAMSLPKMAYWNADIGDYQDFYHTQHFCQYGYSKGLLEFFQELAYAANEFTPKGDIQSIASTFEELLYNHKEIDDIIYLVDGIHPQEGDKPVDVDEQMREESTFARDVSEEERDQSGKWTTGSTGSDAKAPTGKEKAGVRRAFEAAAKGFGKWQASLKTVEHHVVSEISKRFERLPKKVQIITKAILKTTFASYITMQKAGAAIAFQKGGAEHAERIAHTLIGADLVAAKIGPLTIGAIAGPAAASVAYWLPLASCAYVTYSAARNPIATYRAAKHAIDSAMKAGKHLASSAGSSYSKMPALFDDDRADEINLLLDCYNRAENPDWMEALLSSALDYTKNVKSAVLLAESASTLSPNPPGEVDQSDDEVLFGKYNPEEERDKSGKWTAGGESDNRPSKPNERKKGEKPPSRSFIDPPSWPKASSKAPKKNGKPVTGYASNGMNNTTFGDMSEHLATAIGFRNILPEGQRSHKVGEVADKGSSLDLEWDHSGYATECKAVCVEGTEFKIKAKAQELKDKERFATKNKLKGMVTMPIVDTDKGIARFYWRDGIRAVGLTKGNKDQWNYIGEVHFDPKPWKELSELRGELSQKKEEFSIKIKAEKDKGKAASLRGQRDSFVLEHKKKIEAAKKKAEASSIEKVVK